MLKVFSVEFKLYSKKFTETFPLDGYVYQDVIETLMRWYGDDLEYVENIYELDDSADSLWESEIEGEAEAEWAEQQFDNYCYGTLWL